MVWNDETAYDYTKNHSPRDWGWEFIRRNEDYMKEWKKALLDFRKRIKSGEKAPYFNRMDFMPDDFLSDSPRLQFINPSEFETFVIPSKDAEKWGLRGWRDPRTKKLQKSNFLSVEIIHSLGRRDGDSISLKNKAMTIIARIDLQKNLPTQIKEIEHTAKSFQDHYKEMNKLIVKDSKLGTQKDKKLWKSYIRYFDAAAVIPRKEAANYFFGDCSSQYLPTDQWDERLAQAKRMIKEGFQRLIF
jgi:hypothetical protein